MFKGHAAVFIGFAEIQATFFAATCYLQQHNASPNRHSICRPYYVFKAQKGPNMPDSYLRHKKGPNMPDGALHEKEPDNSYLDPFRPKYAG